LNYRHAFHAGNFADVHKHVTLLAMLDYLLQKPKPIFFLDTHAGRGLYDLRSDDAQTGAEWASGVGKLFGHEFQSPLLKRYQQLVMQAQQGAGQLHAYPGSPWLATQVLRADDRRVFIERNPEECVNLRKTLRAMHAPNTTVDDSDGYHALGSFLPPREKRGLVLVDPPFEDSDEFTRLVETLRFAAERWPTGVYALWYPLKSGGLVNKFYAEVKQTGIRKLLISELWLRPLDTPAGLNGSGMLLLNPPWRLDAQLREASGEILPLWSTQGGHRTQWLTPE
jgi:23S rRNA (adenine2030-N6)-methyltransferase